MRKSRNKKSVVIAMVCLLATAVLFTSAKNSKTNDAELWHSWEDGLEKAIDEDKMIMVDFYTDWCGWCKKMDRETYTNAGVKKLIENNAIAIKINPEVDTTYTIDDNEYTGKELAKFLAGGKIYRGYPMTYFWLDPSNLTDGRRKYIQQGYLTPEQMTSVLNKMITIKNK